MTTTHVSTTHVSMTDARADLLLTVVDHLQGGRQLHPLVQRDAVQAMIDLAAEHTRKSQPLADPFATDLRGDHDGVHSYSEAGVAP